MDLRYYQKNAIEAVVNALKADKKCNPCVEAPTGSGKTPIIATLCRIFSEANKRTLCVAHRKELLEQTVDKLSVWAPNAKFSIVSAGLKQQDFSGQVVVAGIQSVYRHTEELLQEGKIDFLLVDEAHLIPTTEENADGMYQTLIKSLRNLNQNLRVIGLTATPYRLNSGLVCGEDKILTEICYKISIPELISNGYLTPLISKAPPSEIESYDFHIEHGEFKTSEVNEAYNVEEVIHNACHQIVKMTKNRKSVLVFCCSKDHCWAVANELQKLSGEETGVVLGDTSQSQRELLLKRFKGEKIQTSLFGDVEKPLKYLCNVDVLTTGFDAPNIDCVVLLRPTASPGLYYQMCGRGLRLFDGKENCLVMDFGGNIERFGGIDEIEPPKSGSGKKKEKKTKKTCPICFSVIDIDARICPECGNKLKCDDFECPRCKVMNDLNANFCSSCGFQFRELAHHNEDFDTEHSILSMGNNPTTPVIEEDVLKVEYFEHTSRKSGKNTLRVDYHTATLTLSEYVCFEHEGYALQKAFRWWCDRTDIRPIPFSVKQAYEIIQCVGISEPTKIKYTPKKPGQFQPDIIDLDVKALSVPELYPHTDNPFNFKCQNCNGESFIYERTPRDEYLIKCAVCNELYGEVSRRTIPNETDFQDELATFKKAGICWYYPDADLDDFYHLAPKVNTSFDELPF